MVQRANRMCVVQYIIIIVVVITIDIIIIAWRSAGEEHLPACPPPSPRYPPRRAGYSGSPWLTCTYWHLFTASPLYKPCPIGVHKCLLLCEKLYNLNFSSLIVLATKHWNVWDFRWYSWYSYTEDAVGILFYIHIIKAFQMCTLGKYLFETLLTLPVVWSLIN